VNDFDYGFRLVTREWVFAGRAAARLKNPMKPKKQSKAEKLLDLLTVAGPEGILNSEIAANPAIGWGFASVIRELRRAGHAIASKHSGQVYRTVLLNAAPAPELPPIIAALVSAQKGTSRA
jgi:hypothetical protein